MSSDVFRTEHDLSDNLSDFDSRWADFTRDESEPDPADAFVFHFQRSRRDSWDRISGGPPGWTSSAVLAARIHDPTGS